MDFIGILLPYDSQRSGEYPNQWSFTCLQSLTLRQGRDRPFSEMGPRQDYLSNTTIRHRTADHHKHGELVTSSFFLEVSGANEWPTAIYRTYFHISPNVRLGVVFLLQDSRMLRTNFRSAKVFPLSVIVSTSCQAFERSALIVASSGSASYGIVNLTADCKHPRIYHHARYHRIDSTATTSPAPSNAWALPIRTPRRKFTLPCDHPLPLLCAYQPPFAATLTEERGLPSRLIPLSHGSST